MPIRSAFKSPPKRSKIEPQLVLMANTKSYIGLYDLPTATTIDDLGWPWMVITDDMSPPRKYRW